MFVNIEYEQNDLVFHTCGTGYDSLRIVFIFSIVRTAIRTFGT